ncbi:hypothetical protein VTK26DRAFT_842 [Humicola hyalothermophila]
MATERQQVLIDNKTGIPYLRGSSEELTVCRSFAKVTSNTASLWSTANGRSRPLVSQLANECSNIVLQYAHVIPQEHRWELSEKKQGPAGCRILISIHRSTLQSVSPINKILNTTGYRQTKDPTLRRCKNACEMLPVADTATEWLACSAQRCDSATGLRDRRSFEKLGDGLSHLANGKGKQEGRRKRAQELPEASPSWSLLVVGANAGTPVRDRKAKPTDVRSVLGRPSGFFFFFFFPFPSSTSNFRAARDAARSPRLVPELKAQASRRRPLVCEILCHGTTSSTRRERAPNRHGG